MSMPTATQSSTSATSSQSSSSGHLEASNMSAIYFLAPLALLVTVALIVSIIVYKVKRRQKRLKKHMYGWRAKRKELLLESLPQPVSWQPAFDEPQPKSPQLSRGKSPSVEEPSTSRDPPPDYEEHEHERDHELCAFCLDDFHPADVIQKLPQCRHYFHATCAAEWIERELKRSESREVEWRHPEPHTAEETLDSISMACPLCRKKLHDQESAPSPPSRPRRAHVRHSNRAERDFELQSVVGGTVR